MSPGVYKILNDPYLDSMRTVGDASIDPVVEGSLRMDPPGFYQLLRSITDNRSLEGLQGTPLEPFAVECQSMMDSADPARVESGQMLFREYTAEIMMLLGALSLPYCYAAANGARVLYLSEKIRNSTHQRLLDTADFVWNVLDKDAFGEDGKGFAATLKTRLIHSMVRHYVRNHREWTTPEEMPVNQEDMAGTNLAFSYMILVGLDKLGHRVSDVQKDGFLYLWNRISCGLGLDQVLLPGDMKQAYWLERTIRRRQFKPSDAGRSLFSALLRYYKETVPATAFKPFIESQMAFLLGEEVSEILDITPPLIQKEVLRKVMTPLALTNRLGAHRSSFEKAQRERERLLDVGRHA